MKVYLVRDSKKILAGLFSTYNHAQKYISANEDLETFDININHININQINLVNGHIMVAICTEDEITNDLAIFGTKMFQIQDDGKFYTIFDCALIGLWDLQQLRCTGELSKLLQTKVVKVRRLYTDWP
uniref:Uncharacterized protein n=1 Tax=Marseillevirus LCMAC102 TaxID=2506603 RepID=A0A481YU15_9VIRU|nr:MAG: hypothetical protein LCMAC102_02320 [Marseillevirus LCMAC102]